MGAAKKVDLVKKKLKSSQRRQQKRLTVRAKFEFSVNYLVDLRNNSSRNRRRVWMSELKWVFLDVGSTLVDESDVYESRCSYVISEKGLARYEFME